MDGAEQKITADLQIKISDFFIRTIYAVHFFYKVRKVAGGFAQAVVKININFPKTYTLLFRSWQCWLN